MEKECGGSCKRTAGIAGAESPSSDTRLPKRIRTHFDFGEFGLRLPQLSEDRAATSSSNSSGALDGEKSPHSASSFSSSCCSSNESGLSVKDSSRFADPEEAKSFETETSTCINANNYDNKFSRETTPSSQFCGEDSVVMDSAAEKNHHHHNRRRKPLMPSQSEIDEFFAVAEKSEQKRCAEKYNFDIVKDLPLENGRYQWMRLKQ